MAGAGGAVGWKLEAGSWKLEAGSWKLEAGSWSLERVRLNSSCP
ncbi:N-acetylmuramoyl-L-alanine amidase [Stutzerimonas nosocomialis]|nr:N-acetylmuramoyl-L-alanine amidase [Stutzerimonas nosocomialis]